MCGKIIVLLMNAAFMVIAFYVAMALGAWGILFDDDKGEDHGTGPDYDLEKLEGGQSGGSRGTIIEGSGQRIFHH